MSADNGVYILKTKDQYRVAHFQNAEYMNHSAITGEYGNEIIPTRIIELWGDSKFTKKENVALHVAHRWAESLKICEYGVNIVRVNKTWNELMKDAVPYAKREMEAIRNHGDEKYWNLEKLQKISDGYYLNAYFRREQYDRRNI